MEYKNDFLEREIQKITLFLRKTLSKMVNDDDVFSLQVFNEELNGKLDFGFYELLDLKKEDLKAKIEGVDVLILEELLKVFYQIGKSKMITLEHSKLIKSSLIIIEELENNTKVYSLERQQIKNYFKSEKKRN
ncbi:hypothetical protein QWY81_00660 [Polaribacter undariae]|uniref:Uncharacterized protein n=1 Tax=Polaribacter sejongensis TaxID=985043 RepID=A0AAJ1QTB7_9FLAO|nr:hypothetical protein [Polaribacter undariae]MDN3617959.1 hypothetical protein [Polaribacter undariae]UWD32009.1 hypothetical protein NQP51_18005 [Polaribacter undariae]